MAEKDPAIVVHEGLWRLEERRVACEPGFNVAAEYLKFAQDVNGNEFPPSNRFANVYGDAYQYYHRLGFGQWPAVKRMLEKLRSLAVEGSKRVQQSAGSSSAVEKPSSKIVIVRAGLRFPTQ